MTDQGKTRRRWLAVWVAALLPVVLLGLGTTLLRDQAERDQGRRAVITASDVAAALADSRAEDLLTLVQGAANGPLMRRGFANGDSARLDAQVIRQRLRQLLRSTDNLAGAIAVTTNGQLVSVQPAVPELVGADLSDRDWFQGVQRLNVAYMSPAYRAALPNQPWVVAAAAPVTNGSGQTIGVVAVAYDLADLQQNFRSLADAHGVRITLVDRNRRLLASPDPGSVGRPADLGAAPNPALGGTGGQDVETADGGKAYRGFAPVDAVDWAVVAELPASVAYPGGLPVRTVAWALTALLAALVTAVLLRLRRSLRISASAFGRLREQTGDLADSRLRYRQALDALAEAVVVVGDDLRLRAVNRAAEPLLGFGPADVGASVAERGWSWIHEDGTPVASAAGPIPRGLRGESVRGSTLGLVRPDAPVRWLLISCQPLRREGENSPYAVVASASDVTLRREADVALADSEARFRLAFDHSVVGLLRVEAATGRIVEANPAVCQLLNYRATALTNRSFADLLPADEEVDLGLTAASSPRPREHRLLSRDGQLLWVTLRLTPIAQQGLPPQVLIQVVDLSERRDAAREVRHQALHDALTELPSRLLLMDRAAVALARAQRGGHWVVAFFVTLEALPEVNSVMGEGGDDAVLREVATRLRLLVRAADTVARVGVSDFVVLCELEASSQRTARGIAGALACRLVADLDEPVPCAGGVAQVRASVGVALATEGRADDLVDRAEAAMRRASEERCTGAAATDSPAARAPALRPLDTAVAIAE